MKQITQFPIRNRFFGKTTTWFCWIRRKLPRETVYLHLFTPEEVWDAIVTLAVRGAPAIGIAAVYGLYMGVRHVTGREETFFSELERVVEYLSSARPTAVNLSWALNRVKAKVESFKGSPVSVLKQAVWEEATAIHEEDVRVCRKMGEHLLPFLHDGMGILTHCNAGGLATGAYGTALAPLYLAREKGWNLESVCRRDAAGVAGSAADRI